MNFINDTQTSPTSLLVELITKRGGDAMNANTMEFIHDL
jgi:hypothetical protein